MLTKPRALAPLLVGIALCGCGPGPGTTTKVDAGGGGGGGGRDLAVIPPGCSGTLKGALNGRFTACTVSVTQGLSDQTVQLIPSGFTGDAISTFQIAIVITGKIQANSYKAKDIALGSLVTVTDRATAARYVAEPQFSGFRGQLELNVTSPPKNPGTDMTWADKSMHGALAGTLVHDPDTSGDPNATVALAVTF